MNKCFCFFVHDCQIYIVNVIRKNSFKNWKKQNKDIATHEKQFIGEYFKFINKTFKI